MHWFHVDKTIHNEQAVREYEREESRRIGRWLRWGWLLVPILLAALWLLFRGG
jgi:hypothetical protein